MLSQDGMARSTRLSHLTLFEGDKGAELPDSQYTKKA